MFAIVIIHQYSYTSTDLHIDPKCCLFLSADRAVFDKMYVTELENWVDEYTEKLPELTEFILPVSDVQSLLVKLLNSVNQNSVYHDNMES